MQWGVEQPSDSSARAQTIRDWLSRLKFDFVSVFFASVFPEKISGLLKFGAAFLQEALRHFIPAHRRSVKRVFHLSLKKKRRKNPLKTRRIVGAGSGSLGGTQCSPQVL